MKASTLFSLTLAAICFFASAVHAQDAAGYCIQIKNKAGVAQATLELPRDQTVTIRGELGTADDTISALSEGGLAKDSALLILEIEAGDFLIRAGFPIAEEAWKKKLAVMDQQLPHWGQLGDLNGPGVFTVGSPVGIILEGNKLTFFPENSDPLVAPLN